MLNRKCILQRTISSGSFSFKNNFFCCCFLIVQPTSFFLSSNINFVKGLSICGEYIHLVSSLKNFLVAHHGDNTWSYEMILLKMLNRKCILQRTISSGSFSFKNIFFLLLFSYCSTYLIFSCQQSIFCLEDSFSWELQQTLFLGAKPQT